jgi:hypothetical protein
MRKRVSLSMLKKRENGKVEMIKFSIRNWIKSKKMKQVLIKIKIRFKMKKKLRKEKRLKKKRKKDYRRKERKRKLI